MITNFRDGFACNSSSTHSIIFIDDFSKIEDDYCAHDDADYGFGWDNFILASVNAKKIYLSSMLYINLLDTVGADTARLCIKEWCGMDFDEYKNYGIDHQSVFVFPNNYNGVGINLEFFKEFFSFICRDEIVIIGGNDNSNIQHPLLDKYHPINFSLFFQDSVIKNRKIDIRARKDYFYDYWTLFDYNSGKKIRLSFHDGKNTLASFPELVDVKITNRCSHDCAFCYQNSSKNGLHCSVDDIIRLKYLLEEMEVFEISLGGGEPLQHPKFDYIINVLTNGNFAVNFTTKEKGWLNNTKLTNNILRKIKGIAFSINDSDDVRDLGYMLKNYEYDTEITINVIDKLYSKYDFLNICKECARNNFRLMILGYKEYGRGKEYDRLYDDYHWYDVLKDELYFGSVGVDTLIVQQDYNALHELGVDDVLFTKNEGFHSCYIDLIDKYIAPSSFTDEKYPFSFYTEKGKLAISKESFYKIFASFNDKKDLNILSKF